MAPRVSGRDDAAMSKRIAVGVLWFIAGSYLGSWIAYALGSSELIAPLMGLVGVALFAGDPFRLVWKPSPTTSPRTPAFGAPATPLDLDRAPSLRGS